MVILGKKKSKGRADRLRLAEELQIISEQLALSEAGFNEICDSDLLEAAIYERSALMARYSYLIKEMKRLEAEGR